MSNVTELTPEQWAESLCNEWGILNDHPARSTLPQVIDAAIRRGRIEAAKQMLKLSRQGFSEPILMDVLEGKAAQTN